MSVGSVARFGRRRREGGVVTNEIIYRFVPAKGS
jgi:hypothetical protein